jgi:ATP-binding cassette subfamily B protein/subfamily B ATP-binding cassette protein MsbA
MKSIYWRVAQHYAAYAKQILFALILMIASIVLNSLKPWPLQWIIDEVIPKATNPESPPAWHAFKFQVPEALLLGCISIILIHLIQGLLHAAHTYWLIKIGLEALVKLRTQIYTYLQYLPLHFHDARKSSDSTFRVAYDSQAIQTFFNRGFATIISSALTLAVTFTIMHQMHPQLAYIAMAITPILWLTIVMYAKRIRAESTIVQQQESDVFSRAQEGITTIRIVHAFGREEQEVATFRSEANQSKDANLRLTITNLSSSLFVGLIIAVGTATIIYFGASAVIDGSLSLGKLTVFLSYLVMLYQPLEQLSYMAWDLEGAAAGMQRVYEIIDTGDTVPEAPNAKPLPPIAGHIRFNNVHFAYQPDHPILRGLTLDISPGQSVAIVGGTGAGKTTILSLLPRFYDPQQGSITIDNYNIRYVTKKSLRNQISLVLQDTILLNGTIAENIGYGKLGATQTEIEAAAEAAQALDFIRDLSHAFQTQVGERGVRLSGGQRQRIALARAFLKKAPILLLDEPTSALDLATEAEIMQTLKKLIRLQTTIIVTHRLSTIHNLVDIIYVLKDGQLIESGTGAQLLSQNGHYAELWKHQATTAPS